MSRGTNVLDEEHDGEKKDSVEWDGCEGGEPELLRKSERSDFVKNVVNDCLHDDEAGLEDDDGDDAGDEAHMGNCEGFPTTETEQPQRLKSPKAVPNNPFHVCLTRKSYCNACPLKFGFELARVRHAEVKDARR